MIDSPERADSMLASTPVQGPRTPAALGLDPALDACGLNVAGVLRAETYDALVPSAWKCGTLLPTARSIYVIGSGGSAFYANARAERAEGPHPLDAFCEARVASAVLRLDREGIASRACFYWERRGDGDGEFADFVALARAAGLGSRSLIGLLLHPDHGPWFAIRAVVLTDRCPPVAGDVYEAPDFCADCPAPCIDICPARAVTRSGMNVVRCSEWRHREAQCAASCDARLACPVGRESRYTSEALAHHMTSHFRSD